MVQALKVKGELPLTLTEETQGSGETPARITDVRWLEAGKTYNLLFYKSDDYDAQSEAGYSLQDHLQIKNIKTTFTRVSEPGSKPKILCPFIACGKTFSESGNLKTHFRIHVSLFCEKLKPIFPVNL